MQDYEALGATICELSRTPILGSDIRDGDIRKWFAWELAGQSADAVIATAAEGGLIGAGAALKVFNRASVAATAVDAFCRWGRP